MNNHRIFASRRALIAGILATTALAFSACSQDDGVVTSQSAADIATVEQTDGNASNANSGNMPNPTGSNPDAGTVGNSDDNADGTNASETVPSQDGGETNGDTETMSSSASENADIGQALRDLVYSNPSPGTTFTAGGEELTVCVFGDGYGTNLVVAGPNTSCEFATEVFNQQTEGLNASADNIRDNLKPNIQATSPTTGKTYDVSCGSQADGVVECSGGNDARIYIN
ncbi:MAG: hypothetical protein Q4E11_03010 [Corynebacterium sp.]|uniref:hypothetical protein n=1 Tax=Corynebacterium sp. TaxID=1720 RepID=UPI0026DBA723|nr:hypothetical protein [Corynebacterium sp.]MDO5029538.1 hypothetical protein [Corynebacterium sp.]